MQTKEQIHNANVLAKAMAQQKILCKADEAYEALTSLLMMEYSSLLEPIDTIHLHNAVEVLCKFNAKRVYNDLAKELQ